MNMALREIVRPRAGQDPRNPKKIGWHGGPGNATSLASLGVSLANHYCPQQTLFDMDCWNPPDTYLRGTFRGAMRVAQYCVVRIKAGHLARKILADPGPQKFSAPSDQASAMPTDCFKNPKNPAGAQSPSPRPYPKPARPPSHPREGTCQNVGRQGRNRFGLLVAFSGTLLASEAHLYPRAEGEPRQLSRSALQRQRDCPQLWAFWPSTTAPSGLPMW